MPPRISNRGHHLPLLQGREFSPAEKMFICNLKMSGEKYPNFVKLFTQRFGKSPPTMKGANKMVNTLTTKFTVMDRRKGRSGGRVTVRTPRNIELVRRTLGRASSRKLGQPSPSARRHTEKIKKSSYNNITRKDLRLRPYKILRLHKVTEQQTVARLKMGRILARKSAQWYINLCVSDEALVLLIWTCLEQTE